mgnify:FL=1
MKFIILMLIDLLVLAIAVPIGFALKNIYVNAVLTIIPLVILGFLINKYPFATPDTNRKLGIKNTVKITKIMCKVIMMELLFQELYWAFWNCYKNKIMIL